MATRCRNTEVLCEPKVLSHSLVDCIEERLILLDWTAERTPELVLLKLGYFLTVFVEEVLRIQSGVPQVFKRVAVELVRSALADCHHLAAHGQSILSREIGRDDFVLHNAVDT